MYSEYKVDYRGAAAPKNQPKSWDIHIKIDKLPVYHIYEN